MSDGIMSDEIAVELDKLILKAVKDNDLTSIIPLVEIRKDIAYIMNLETR